MAQENEEVRTPVQTITLNDGTVWEGHIMDGGDGIMIFVYMTGMDLLTGVSLFSNPERTGRILFTSYGHEYIYEGYTVIWSVSAEFGNCNLTMKKGRANA